MKNTTKQGVIGALMDEYKYAVNDLKAYIKDVKDEDLKVIVDHETKNKDCVSIQSVLTHIIFWGDNYITMIDIDRGNANSAWGKRVYYDTVDEYMAALEEMYERNIDFFEQVGAGEMVQLDPTKKIKTGWAQLYDYEQLMEHAIVHIYRHRRQIQGFKRILENLA